MIQKIYKASKNYIFWLHKKIRLLIALQVDVNRSMDSADVEIIHAAQHKPSFKRIAMRQEDTKKG